MAYEISAGAIGNAIGKGIQSFANHSAQAANRANGVSAAAQAAQGSFNQASANNANTIGTDRIAQQYGYNAAQAAMSNDFAMDSWNQAAAWNEAMWQKNADWQEKMWEKTADWNEKMWQKSADYNTAEALAARNWQESMMKTAYQRAVTDMSKAGLNPILAVTGGGISTGAGSGSAASIGSSSMGSVGSSAPSMSALSGHMASGGLMNGLSASEGNYTGQMEYMGGMLGLLSAAIGGISSAMQALGGMGVVGEGIGQAIAGIMDPKNQQEFKKYWEQGRRNQSNPNYKPNYRNGIDWNMKNYSKGYTNILTK